MLVGSFILFEFPTATPVVLLEHLRIMEIPTGPILTVELTTLLTAVKAGRFDR